MGSTSEREYKRRVSLLLQEVACNLIRSYCKTDLPLSRFSTGKVRDTYDLGDRLLMVTTDRISAFDCVLPSGIPDKGRVLTELSSFWFDYTADLLPNHLISTSTDSAGCPLGLPWLSWPGAA